MFGIRDVDWDRAREEMRKPSSLMAFRNMITSLASQGLRIPQTLTSPLAVVWSLSRRCNLRCAHCYQEGGMQSSDELSLEEKLVVADQLAEAGVALVVLSGGEPLLDENVFTLIERLTSTGVAVGLDSNGTMIDDETAMRLKRSGISSIQISIDSSSAEKHDRFRGMNGAFWSSLRAVESCARAGIFTTVATTVTRDNFLEMADMKDIAGKFGARRFAIFDLIPAGRGKSLMPEALRPEQRMALMRSVEEWSLQGDMQVMLELPQLAVHTLKGNPTHTSSGRLGPDEFSVERLTVTCYFNLSGERNPYLPIASYLGGCPAGRLYCNIQPNGNVTPCMFMPSYPVAGNLKSESFERIWNHSEVFTRLRDRELLNGSCMKCRYKFVCGGCRAKAAALSRDYLGPDPTCSFHSAS
jgi:radical SAM protein with 4Fe4S-binding SPASM domain